MFYALILEEAWKSWLRGLASTRNMSSFLRKASHRRAAQRYPLLYQAAAAAPGGGEWPLPTTTDCMLITHQCHTTRPWH